MDQPALGPIVYYIVFHLRLLPCAYVDNQFPSRLFHFFAATPNVLTRSNQAETASHSCNSRLTWPCQFGFYHVKREGKADHIREPPTGLASSFLLHLEYCCPLLLRVGRGQVKKLEDTNNYILRSILGCGKNTSYNHLLNMPWYKNARREKKNFRP